MDGTSSCHKCKVRTMHGRSPEVKLLILYGDGLTTKDDLMVNPFVLPGEEDVKCYRRGSRTS